MKRKLRKPTENKVLTNVGFRLEPERSRELANEAASFEMSPHALARIYVEEALRAKQTLADALEALGKVRLELQSLQRDVRFLRQDVALASEFLLQTAGKIPGNEAAKWVRENMNVAWKEAPKSTIN